MHSSETFSYCDENVIGLLVRLLLYNSKICRGIFEEMDEAYENQDLL